MASSPIATPAQAQQILDLSNNQFNTIRSYFGINDNPFQPDRTYIVFDATSGNNTLHLDTGGSTNYSILKGDGTLAVDYTDTGGNKTLNYAVAGRYLIVIDGDFNGIDTTGATGADKDKYIGIIGGTNYPTTIIANAFDSCENLKNVIFTSVTTIATEAFLDCIGLQTANIQLATSVQLDSFSGCNKLLSLITGIGTPETQVKGLLNLHGNSVLTCAKTGTNHLFTVELYDNSIFTAISDGSILDGDTIEDSEGTTFTIAFKQALYIIANMNFKIEISGTIAYVSNLNYIPIFRGVLKSKFGSNGTGDGQFQQPRDIKVRNNKVYVSDTQNDNIQIFNLSGDFLAKFGTTGTGDGQFQSPDSLAVTSSYIYVVDSSRDDVQIFDLDGVFQSKFGSSGTGDGQFQNPTYIAVSDTNIYVVDEGRDDVQIFNLSGVFQSKFGSSGSGDGEFTLPRGLAVTDDYIYVCDTGRVQLFNLSGVFQSKFGTFGTGDEQLGYPNCLAVTDTSIYIVEATSRLRIFDLNGVFLTIYNSSGAGDGQLQQAEGVDVIDNEIYVVEGFQDCVKRF